MTDRKAACPCGSGRRYKACCFPLDRRREALIAGAREAQQAVDAAVRVVLPVVAERSPITCREGCNDCCRHLVHVSPAEAVAIAQWLRQPAQVETRARFETALVEWRERGGRELELVDELMMRGGVPQEAGPAFDRFVEAASRLDAHGSLCAFNGPDGRCMIYPVRPVACRRWFVTSAVEDCRPGSARTPAVVEHTLLLRAEINAEASLDEVSRHGGAGWRRRSLPMAVAEALVEK